MKTRPKPKRKTGSLRRRVKRLCLGVINEAINKGYADLWKEDWNPKAHVQITLTIAELRIAASIVNFHPTPLQIHRAEEAQDWREYIAELDGVE